MPAPVSSREPLGSEPDPLPGGFDTPLAIRALEAAGTGVCIADARRPMLPLVWANEAFSDRTGLPLDEIAGGSCRMLQWADTDSAGAAGSEAEPEDQAELFEPSAVGHQQ